MVVLRVRPVGEIHAGVQLLGRESGVIDAMAYGARSRRGSLRGQVVLFARGTCYLYTDPVKQSTKITDLAVDAYHPEIRENLKKYYVATLWAELILASYAAGSEGEAVWELMSRSLALLAAGDESKADEANIQFLWHYLALLGMRPEIPEEPRGMYRYRPELQQFEHLDGPSAVEVREREGEIAAAGFPVSAGSLAYLKAAEIRPVAETARLISTVGQRRELKELLFRLVQDASERELKTIRSGRGIL